MPKNIVVFCDGTWNTLDPDGADGQYPTNIARLSKHTLRRDDQVVLYIPGVGTDGNKIIEVIGGATGSDIDKKIKEGYGFIYNHYEEGDRIFIVGFSRGAYTARSIAGMIDRLGLPPVGDLPEEILDRAYKAYRGNSIPHTEDFENFVGGFITADVEVLAVFDTVGALGIPLMIAEHLNAKKHGFHNTDLGSYIKHAYHAVALDERREKFKPTLWTDVANLDGRTCEQVWFCGVHCDVGGGYKEQSHSDQTLKWMLKRLVSHGLLVTDEGIKLQPDPKAQIHDSSQHYKFFEPRTLPKGAVVHSSVAEAVKAGTYPPAAFRENHPLKEYLDHLRNLNPGEDFIVP